jgi:hypothetical protein
MLRQMLGWQGGLLVAKVMVMLHLRLSLFLLVQQPRPLVVRGWVKEPGVVLLAL